MKASDLRYGNLVFEDGVVNTIVLIAEDSGQLLTPQGNIISCRLETVKPIPLTEDWLLKFGFTHNGGYSWDCKKLGCQRFIENHFTKGYFETNYESKHIQYVHQLQNLYFALTGTELTIK